MLARRVLGMVAQLRFGHAAGIASLSADIALAGVYRELGDIEQRDAFASSLQVVLDPKREPRSLRAIPGVLAVSIARGEKQDMIPRVETPDELRARRDQPALRAA